MDTMEHVRSPQSKGVDTGVAVTPEKIERFLSDWRAKGRVEGTLTWYRRGLNQLYEALPSDKRIRRGTLKTWREELARAGYAPSTINLYLSVANTYLEYIGRREYQLPGTLRQEERYQPEMTRREYLRLLQTAKILDKEKAYLLVKLFATTDLPVQEVEKVTVEALSSGRVAVTSGGIRQSVRLPGCLCRELRAYAERQGLGSGPIFVTKCGKPMSRTYVTRTIGQLCEEAHVPEEKGNPRCLRRLYTSMRDGIEANIALLVEQAMDRQLEQEQLIVGWDA